MKKTSYFLRLILGVIVVGVVAFMFTNGTRFLNENNSMQRKAQIELEDYIDSGKEFPVGKYVSLEVRWVLGPFATETSTSTTNGIEATSSVVDYYFLVLEDGTVMALATQNKNEKATLNRMSDWLFSVDGYPMNGETIRLQGELRKLTGDDMLKLYRDHLRSIFGLSQDDPAVRYLVLDTTAGRETLYIIIFGALAVLILIYVVKRKSKKRESQAAQGYDGTGNA